MEAIETMEYENPRFLKSASEKYDEILIFNDESALFNQEAPSYVISFAIGGVRLGGYDRESIC